MKLAVVFEIKEGTSPERAKNLALGIATMVNAAVRGEPDVTVNMSPTEIDVSKSVWLSSLLEKK